MTTEDSALMATKTAAPRGGTRQGELSAGSGTGRPEAESDPATTITVDDLLPGLTDEEFRELGFEPPGSPGYHNLPAELCARPQWVVWRRHVRHGRLTKVPYAPTPQRGRRAAVDDPATWGTFADACAAAERWAHGLGFVFTVDDPFLGVDLDDCLDGSPVDPSMVDGAYPDDRLDGSHEVHPEVVRIVRLLDSYTERSPSGTGLHVVVKAHMVGERHRTAQTAWGGNIEAYDRARFFCMTGDVWLGTPPGVEPRQEQLAGVIRSWLPPATEAEAAEPAPLSEEALEALTRARAMPDAELLGRARTAENGAKFERLWRGDVGGYDSPSEADLALCGLLAFWVGPDPERIERLLWESALAREKWERNDYLQRTIRTALNGRVDFYAGGAVSSTPDAGRVSLPERDCGVNRKTAPIAFTGSRFTSQSSVGGSKNPTAAATTVEEVGEHPGARIQTLSLPLDAAGRTARELRDDTPTEPPWLVPGVIAQGWLVKLAGREKAGKGTLIAYLLGALERGEPTVFGPAPSEPVTALVYSEEPAGSLGEKLRSFNVVRATVVHGWELGRLTWAETAQWLVAKALHEGHGLIFVDNVSRATETEDESGTELGRKVELLADLAKPHGLAVLVDHHHRKSGGKVGDRSRGGTALAGACENNVELEHRGDWESRERHLSSRGRVEATIWEKRIVLSSDGADYAEATGEDFRVRVLRERDQWTVKGFADAIDRSEDVARRWLKECPHVRKAKGGRGASGGGRTAAIYRVVEPGGPPL
jgi:putative DNA primase/helicase